MTNWGYCAAVAATHQTNLTHSLSWYFRNIKIFRNENYATRTMQVTPVALSIAAIVDEPFYDRGAINLSSIVDT